MLVHIKSKAREQTKRSNSKKIFFLSRVGKRTSQSLVTSTHGTGFTGGSDGKESACSAGDQVLILGLGRSPGGGHSNPLQYSYLENLMDRGAWWATVHGVMRVGHG